MTNLPEAYIPNLLAIQKHLEGLLDGSITPDCWSCGICDEISSLLGINLSHLWLGLPKRDAEGIWIQDDEGFLRHSPVVDLEDFKWYSGSRVFPIKPADDQDPDDAYFDGGDLWCTTGDNQWRNTYNQRRWDFIQFLSNELQRILT